MPRFLMGREYCMEDQDNNLSVMLSRRAVPPMPRKDLSERIIHAALLSSRDVKIPWYNYALKAFSFSAPRAAMAACLVVLIAVGSVWNVNTPAPVMDDEFTMVLDVYNEDSYI